MTLLPSSPDYSDRDFDSLRLRLQNLIKGVFPNWTDFEAGNFGNILLELYAFVGDALAFYLDNQGRESRVLTATQRKNMIALVKLIGYTPATGQAATATETITLAEVPANDVIIPEGSIFRTADIAGAVEFQALADLTIPAGSNPPTIETVIENSETLIEVFDSTGLPNQKFALQATPYIDGSTIITAADGSYTKVLNFLNSTSVDRHFVVVVDQSDQAEIRFSNGANGAVPQGTINVAYRVGGGIVGNVEAGSISTLEGSYTDVLGNPVTVSVTNVAAASGGVDRESLEEIRQLAPESLRVLNRTVSREDYEINAKRIAGVSRALMLTSNEDTGIEENEGILHVIPSGGGLPTALLKATVLEQVTVTFPNTLTFTVFVQDPVYLVINIAATVFLAQGRSEVAVRGEIEAALAAYFQLVNSDGTVNENVDFGFNYKDNAGAPAGEIPWSDIFNVVRDVAGVRKVSDDDNGMLLNGESSDVAILVREFPKLGTITLTNGATGLQF